MNERRAIGREFERRAWTSLDGFERMILEAEFGVKTGRLRGDNALRAAASIQSVASSTAQLFAHEPGPDALPEARVKLLGDKLAALGERAAAVLRALGVS